MLVTGLMISKFFMDATRRPAEHVLGAFGATLPMIHMLGGQGTTWLAKDVVLKPLDMAPEALHWQADVLRPLLGREDLRLAAPLMAKDGSLIVDGWTAWNRLEGTSDQPGKWDEIIRAGVRFCELMQHVPRPSFLNSRQDTWAAADRIAWGEQAPESVLHVRFVSRLLDALKVQEQVEEPSQIVHGDLTGNVLFSANEGPAVIDISPYWRPRSYGTAIVLVDALTWEDAPLDWAHGYLGGVVEQQAFIRALLFRILSDYLRNPSEPICVGYERPVELICRLIAFNDM